MANTFDPFLAVAGARALKVLRESTALTRLVNVDTDTTAVQEGDVINMSIASDLVVTDVIPGPGPVTPLDSAPRKVTVTLNQWKKTNFHLTDKERMMVSSGIAGGQADQAVRALANNVNGYLWTRYVNVYGFVGTPGTTPFQTTLADVMAARAILNRQLAPVEDRGMAIDVMADAALMANPYIAANYARGDSDANKRGLLGPVGGFDPIVMDNAVPTHVAGTITTGLIAKAATAVAIGLKTVIATTAAATGACNLKVGDIILFAGSTQTHVLTAVAVQAAAATDVTLAFEPGLAVALVGSEAITVKASHVVNLAFHRDAFAFSSRPLQSEAARGNSISLTDPQTGLTLRVELVRQHKQDMIEYDILYGATLVRPELAVRVAG